MKVQVINNNNTIEEIEIIVKEIDYLSDQKANRLLGANGKCYRLTAKSYTALKKMIKE